MNDLERLGFNLLVALAEVAFHALINRTTPDAWEFARQPSIAAFKSKFGVDP